MATIDTHNQKANDMANSAMVHARVDAETKLQAQGVLNELGMTLSEAISLYLRQIVFRKGIPFEVKIPNELTMRTIQKSERGEELHEASSVQEMFKELDS
jgi:DNA-damage-inducible protein J